MGGAWQKVKWSASGANIATQTGDQGHVQFWFCRQRTVNPGTQTQSPKQKTEYLPSGQDKGKLADRVSTSMSPAQWRLVFFMTVGKYTSG